MPKEKEAKKITRRRFLAGSAALVGSALLSGCGPDKKPSPTQELSPQAETKPSVSPSPTPTSEQVPTTVPSPEPTVTPEQTPTKEEVKIPGLVLTEEYLKGAFAGIGGEKQVDGETTLVSFGKDYVSFSWGKEVDFVSLSEDSIASLKYLVSLGAYRGEEGIFTPGKEEEEVIFPHLAKLSLARLTLANVPTEVEQKSQESKEWVSPQNFLLRPDTQMTVVGLLDKYQPAEEAVVDKDGSGEQLDYALVAFTDYLRADEGIEVPRHYFAVVPTYFPADPDNKNALTLANLLEANGYRYDFQNKGIIFGDQEKQVNLELNQIKGDGLLDQVRRASGLYFVDQMKGEVIKNPVVPYPDEMPEVWKIEEQESEGGVSLLLQSQEEGGTFQDFARARYDQEKDEWMWSERESLLDIESAPKIKGMVAVQEEGKIIYKTEPNNPYGFEEGFYCGEVVSFTCNGEKSNGVGLVSEVLGPLIKEHQTIQALAEQKEKFPLPFDPRGMDFEIGEVNYHYRVMEIEVDRSFLGIDIPRGTKIYNPVFQSEIGIGDGIMSFGCDKEYMPFDVERKDLSDRCLQAGNCQVIEKWEDIEERVRIADVSTVSRVDVNKITAPGQWEYVKPFSFWFSANNEQEIPSKKGFDFGEELFELDSDEPAVEYIIDNKYPLLVSSRQIYTRLTSLFTVAGQDGEDKLVFILPS